MHILSIALPARPQPDTLVAIAILRIFGTLRLPGVENANIVIVQDMDRTEQEYLQQGILLIDVGKGIFDHHNKLPKTTASKLVCDYLGVTEKAVLSKVLEYAQRDDFFGRGTVSADPLDRAFGLSALIAALNKQYPLHPDYVAQMIVPLIEAHIRNEIQNTEGLPREFAMKKENGEIVEFEARQRDKKLKVVMIKSDNPSMAGFLKSGNGGGFDVVVQQSAAGNTNILTRPLKRIDLRGLAEMIRLKEAKKRNIHLPEGLDDLSRPGQHRLIRDWYYDRATNSIQNGGLNPQQVEATKIEWGEWKEILAEGLAK